MVGMAAWGVLGPDHRRTIEETSFLPLGLPGAGLALRASGDRLPGWEAFSAGAGVSGPAADPLPLPVLPSATLHPPRPWLPWNLINQAGRPPGPSGSPGWAKPLGAGEEAFIVEGSA